MRRTRLTPLQIKNLLRRFYFLALFLVALAAAWVIPGQLPPQVILAILALTFLEPALFWLVPARLRPEPTLLSSLLDLAIASAVYFLSGAGQGPGIVLLFPVVALAATDLVLEGALAIATIGSLIFSTNLISAPIGLAFDPNLLRLGTNLVLSYGLVLIIHFAVTGQQEASIRRERERALAEARRLVDQEQMLVQLSRDITNTSSLADILQIVLETTRRFIPFKGGSIALIDANRQLYVAAALPAIDEAVARLRLPLGQGILGWIAEHQKPYYAPDLDRETQVPPSFRKVGSNASIRSYLGVPLVARGHLVGTLQVDSADVDAFTEEHLRLLQSVAAQVAGAIENARLLSERESFSARLQAIYDAANELTSHFDLDFVLEEFGRRASELLNARYAAAAALDERGQLEKFVTVGLTEEQRQSLGPLPERHGVLEQVLSEQKTICLADIASASPADAASLPPHHPIVHTLLATPLIARGETQGAIYLADKLDGQPFNAADQELLLLLAAGASAAVSNARLYAQLRRNIEQLYALHQIGQAIGSSLSPDDVYRAFSVDVRHLCAAEASVISIWNTAETNLVVQSEDGAPDLLRARRLADMRRHVEKASRGGPAVNLSLAVPEVEGGQLYGSLAPLIVRGRVLGLAEIYSHTRSVLAAESLSIFQTLAAQLAVSTENARLYTQLQKREQQLRDFVAKLFEAEDKERRRLAYDIHDGLAQLIVSADMHMSNYASMRAENPELADQQLDKGLTRLQSALTEVRRFIAELRPSTLDDFGLVNTLRRYVEQLAVEQGWDYIFEENLGDLRLDAAIETGAYRIVQEALSNVRKYSDAPRVEVEIQQRGDSLHLRVQDWGKGFDLDEARQREGHFGLSSMEERARLLAGTFQIDSRPGEGTRIDVYLPCYRAIPAVRA